MRDIEFKAKRIDNGEWFFGNLIIYGDILRPYDIKNYYIENYYGEEKHEVIPETICQYTGLKDKNGNEIYEGDEISLHQFLFDGEEYENELIGIIVYDGKSASYGITNIKHLINKHMGYKDNVEAKENIIPICHFYGLHEESFEIIGNIHDKELLK